MKQHSEFISKSNYLLGFVASLIGLAAFKDNLAAISISVMSLKFNLLDVAIPMILIMLLAAYLSALAQFSTNISFTKIPVSKYLSTTSSFIAILALLYPLVFSVLLGIAKAIELLNTSFGIIIDFASAAIAFIAIISSTFVALKSAINISKIRQEKELLYAIKNLENFNSFSHTTDSNSSISAHYFLQKYEEVIYTIVKYLKVQGYGVGRTNLLELARILQSKDVYNATDVDYAAELNKLRNDYAHGVKDLNTKLLVQSISRLETLYTKTVHAFYKLNIQDIESE